MATARRAGDGSLDAHTERDRQVLEACGTLAIVGLPALVVFAAYNALTLSGPLATPIVIHYGALAALFAIVGQLARCERFIPYSHALAALLGAGVFSVALHVLRVRHDPYQTIYAALVFVALGCVMLSVRWTVGTVAALTVAWLAGSHGSVDDARWREMGLTLCGAGTIGVAVAVARGSALRRLAELARTDRQRRRQLERTLEAAEKEIRERARAERRYAQLVDDVEGIVWEADARLDRFHFVSRHAERVLGFAPAEWIGQPGLFRSRLQPEDEPRCTAVAAAVVAGRHEPGVVECRLRRRDGETAWLRILMRRAAVEGGGLRLRGLMVDLTAQKREEQRRRRLEAKLREANRLEALGTLAGGVAHDFNNLLTAILGHIDLLLCDAPEDEALREGLEVIQNAAERGAALTRQLLGFARRRPVRRDRVDLDAVIEEVVTLLGRTIDKRIVVERTYGLEGEAVLGDEQQLGQVLLNLAVNARDAMPEGGTLRLATRIVEIGHEALDAVTELRPGRYAEVTVEDTGCGIEPEVLPRIFEPFFTTKAGDRGTGMGLAMVYGIVRSHDGSIAVRSEPGRGTRFTLHLPLASAQRLAGPSPKDGHRGDERREVARSACVLLVDDEEPVRDTGRRVLEHLGYEVIAASGGPEALERFEREHGRIDLVILDMVMPEMGGEQCFEALARIDPGVPVLLCTGYSESDAVARLLERGVCGIVYKPYTVERLAEAVAGVLAPS